MGKLKDTFGKVGDKVFGTPEDRKRRAELERQIKVEEREAYNQSYRQARIASARKQGRAKGSKQGGSPFGELGRYAESFSKAGEDFMKLPSWGTPNRSHSQHRTRTVYVKKKVPVKAKRKRSNEFDFF